MLGRRRGGYCFEQNLLFAALLERLGFAVTRLCGRVVLGGAGPERPRTHMLMTVTAGRGRWLADVGFGGGGLFEPVPLEPGAVVRAGDWTHRLLGADVDGAWTLQVRRPGGWLDLYRFTLEPQRPIDYLMANYYTSTHPLSSFTGGVVAQRMEPRRRLALRDHQLVEARPDGSERSRTVADEELGAVLAEDFDIVLTAEELRLLTARRE